MEGSLPEIKCMQCGHIELASDARLETFIDSLGRVYCNSCGMPIINTKFKGKYDRHAFKTCLIDWVGEDNED